MPEDADTASEEWLLPAVSLDVLMKEKLDNRL